MSDPTRMRSQPSLTTSPGTMVRFAVPTGRRRLGILAGGMLGIAAISLVAVLIVAGSAAAQS